MKLFQQGHSRVARSSPAAFLHVSLDLSLSWVGIPELQSPADSAERHRKLNGLGFQGKVSLAQLQALQSELFPLPHVQDCLGLRKP